jgi:hypothetical protein
MSHEQILFRADAREKILMTIQSTQEVFNGNRDTRNDASGSQAMAERQ